MKKKALSKRLTINKETVSNLTAVEMKNMRGGDDSIIISCPAYMTACVLLTACTITACTALGCARIPTNPK